MAQQWYPAGTRPHILINWQSFVNQGIPASWQGAFTDAVINAYTRWMTMAGVDLRFQFYGYTSNTSAGPGELVIQMDPAFGGGTSRLASTFAAKTHGRSSFIAATRRTEPRGTSCPTTPPTPASSTCRRS
jgi:hypothetical protein